MAYVAHAIEPFVRSSTFYLKSVVATVETRLSLENRGDGIGALGMQHRVLEMALACQ